MTAEGVRTGAWRRLRRRLGTVRRLVQSLTMEELLEAMRVVREPASVRRARLEALILGSEGRLVFVCYGNIMRSAFAAAHVRSEHSVLAPRTVGAGTHARPGRGAQQDALAVAPEFGVDLSAHEATPVSALGVRSSDILVGMDLENVARVRCLRGVDPARVFLIGDALEDGDRRASRLSARVVTDPYGKGVDATRAAFVRVRQGADAFARRLTRPD